MDSVGQTDERFDAVVVGAGVSGLAVARFLLAGGLRVKIVEARDRVGGRLYSPGGLDLGATWFWPHEPRVQRLISELGLGVFAQHLEGDAVFHAQQGGQRIAGNAIDVPAGRFVGGAARLAEAMSKALPPGTLRLGRTVTRIERRSEGVRASCDEEFFQGRHVVLALPPALAVASIQFAPALPPEVESIAKQTPVWMGGTTKAVVRYKEAFWRTQGLAGAAFSYHGPLREVHDMSGPGGQPAALFGFAAPSQEGASRVTKESVVDQLGELFGPQALSPTEVVLMDWRKESFTSPAGGELLQRFDLFGHPELLRPTMAGGVLWCSTETAEEAPGHIEGALAAAERVSEHVLNTLAKPPV